MNSQEVYAAIRCFVNNHDHKLENVFVHGWEADVFSVTSSGYSYEIEVKISRSDFFADFKKPKHHFFRTYKKEYGIVIGNRSWIRHGYIAGSMNKDLVDFKVEYTNIQAIKFGYRSSPNKFWYAVPTGMIELHEVPDYAGLIYVGPEYLGSHRIIKKAPFLHKNEINVREMLFDKYYWMSQNQKNEINDLKREITRLKEKINQPV